MFYFLAHEFAGLRRWRFTLFGITLASFDSAFLGHSFLSVPELL
jgi:hypothetical protein